ncbi:hypothetical protein [Deinococcus soli (ex Cha et al. 2016)]|uniref:Copper chaperone PCu(A)C n=2 Tax=Deinococcus soli (ex Cha et al. 2016) TaxID=1309411 RepID=A0AAE3XDT8_9DEIO|nr:hypothetical protein [Deinococcus soli (ex Cha et al. 2016)]MDR6218260.1 hypothetical protein [Deinococcus soli (ex Cha et al. 2016)]MDR6329000.1 hypothetical protein [Deinococcus soli (ex Cha et al. 2016)]MDR6751273.1 hypothetical protein [Deinococcus soli (ex Cha et al. 2016)]
MPRSLSTRRCLLILLTLSTLGGAGGGAVSTEAAPTPKRDQLRVRGADVTVQRNSVDPAAGYGPLTAPALTYAATGPRLLVIRQTGARPSAVTDASAATAPAIQGRGDLTPVTTAPTVLTRVPPGAGTLEVLLDFFMPVAAPVGSAVRYELTLTDAQGAPVTAPQTITVHFADAAAP